ncbi:hypothetical protein ACJMK2_013333 [Sinanodonta woodiana]|uniref:Nucleic-acid-binding protein from transposon X-element n=1 Tax=Sinanodonta woodiana TaxID=1069815 RepID=A0ABD3UYG2_SINWO
MGTNITNNYPLKTKAHTNKILIILESSKPLTSPIKIGKNGPSHKLEPYITKPRFCSNCKHWGHYTSKCKHKRRCNKCGGHHTGQCRRNTYKCVNCKGPHPPAAMQCPAAIRENDIIRIMNQNYLDCYSANIQYNKTRSINSSQERGKNITTRAVNLHKGNKTIKELEKLTNQIGKVIDQTENKNPNLKINVQRSLNHFKTQFFDLITLNNPIPNG